MWGPFRGFVGPVPPPFLMPGSTGWTSSTDRRNNPRSFYGKHTYFGDGDNHHDLISFALLKSDDPSGETLIVMHPVRASFFTNLSTGKLEALFKELSDLQESRMGQWNWMWGECGARQMTLDTLADVLKARKQWLGDGDKGVDLDGDEEDD